MMPDTIDETFMTRRQAVKSLGLAAAGLIALPLTQTPLLAAQEKVTPGEDLMHEHGALRRLLLIYRYYSRQLAEGTALNLSGLQHAARLIRTFVEEYHEKLEETYVFPRFRKANQLVTLVNTLQTQHAAGRRVTARIQAFGTIVSASRAGEARGLIEAFLRMYEPHAAREDTVVFPAFAKLLPPAEYDKLGDKFEGLETLRFGKDGFEHVVAEIATIEKALGLYDLNQFTPR
ncbi:MAG: hemerythrin domain-containing protein [Bacteroidota bacterium]